ncbi:YeeE/YedE family protein [Pigmentiphaga aceris]|uniref:YeeE/YedE family protein n=1 Tax=Pigmentiphaga aceris TaxID=1940612 RepID=A0A5C0AUB5_9BURK|nr:YeeE/YedE family protein [Pigmentiphaga aceris]QEI05982.1 YeeE/YedE family protein [Pigmentiphaga aceris]
MHWSQALLGGMLIGGAAVLLMAGLGRIAGISGIARQAFGRGKGDGREDRGWRLAFLAGLWCAALLWQLVRGGVSLGVPQVSTPVLLLAGLLVGVGTALGGGCTSGHGVCGIARLSPRSLLATAVFMSFGFLTVYVLRHGLPGALS